MNENKIITPSATPKPKKKYTVLKFVIVMIVCMLMGGVIGALLSTVGDNFGSVYASFEQWLILAMPVAQWIWLALSSLTSILLYLAARTATFAFERGGSENEATSTRAEKLLALGMVASQLCMIVGYGLFGVATALPYGINAGMLNGVTVLFIIIIFYSVYSSFAVKLMRRLSPEKQGNPLDFRFEQEWLSSCDEAEKMGIYQAAYASYKATNIGLLVAWVITVIIGMFGALGIYPIVVVTAIWLVHTVSYLVHSIRNGNKKLNR